MARLKSGKLFKSKNLSNNRATKEPKFFTFKARKAFNHLKQAFTKATIFQHFNLERHIRCETNASDYVIGGVQNQLTSNQLILLDSNFSKSDIGQWRPWSTFL